MTSRKSSSLGGVSDALYGLKINKLQGDFKPGLAAFISQHSIRAILIGTRRSESPSCLSANVLDFPGDLGSLNFLVLDSPS